MQQDPQHQATEWNRRQRSRLPPRFEQERVFPPAAASVREARHWVRNRATAWGVSRRVIDDAAFNVSELAANAILHARSPFRVRLSYDRQCVRIAVIDASDEMPRELHAAPEATAGRGFAIVRALSARVGAEPLPPGKQVWSEIEL